MFGWATFSDTKWPAPYSGGNIPADSLPWDVLTHVGLFAANGNTPPQSYYINQYGAFTARAHQSGVFAGITVGGSSDGALVSMIGNSASWDNWITTYLGYIDAHKMDFIDFDFEGSYSSSNIASFFSVLYDSLQLRQSGNDPSRHPFIVLTASVPHAISWSSQTIRDRVEFVNLMTYDYNNNAWGRVTFDNSPKSYKYYNGTGGATDSVGTGVNAIAPSMQRMAIRVNAAGWPMDKLNVGMDYNGGYWSNATMIRQSTSGTSSGGSGETFAGNWSDFAQLPPDSIFFDQIAQAYWARIGTNLWTWLSLPGRDSGVIATRKVVDSMGLGGVCIWNLGNEVWNASPVPPGGKGWFFSQIKKYLDFGKVQEPPPPPPPPPDLPKIKGKVFFDANQNNSMDPGELPVAGRTVTISGPQSAQALSDSSGGFSFEHLPLGGYTVSLTAKSLWTQTLPASGGTYSVSIDSADDVVQANFGVYSPSAFRFPVNRNWNIISVPVTPPDLSTDFTFPLGITPAYSFHDSYEVKDVLTPGEGYWMKFGTGHDVWIAGSTQSRDTVTVSAGWNFIGSISEIVPVTNLRTVPADLLTRYVYGYNGGSYIANEIEPGKGYWVYATNPGKVIIANSGLIPAAGLAVPRQDTGLNELAFVSATGERQSLYFAFDGADAGSFPAPPSPPGSQFTARFGSAGPEGGSMVELLSSASAAPLPVMLTNVASPVSIEWKIAPGHTGGTLTAGNGWSVTLEGNGTLDGYYPSGAAAGSAELVLSRPGGSGTAIPTEYRLDQNFPNPFNGSTVINFSILEESDVRLEVFNVLGETVLTLVDRHYAPGLHSASLRGDELPTGIYLYRLTAENVAGRRFISTRKLVHLK